MVEKGKLRQEMDRSRRWIEERRTKVAEGLATQEVSSAMAAAVPDAPRQFSVYDVQMEKQKVPSGLTVPFPAKLHASGFILLS